MNVKPQNRKVPLTRRLEQQLSREGEEIAGVRSSGDGAVSWRCPDPKLMRTRECGPEVKPKCCTKGIQWKQNRSSRCHQAAKESLICGLMKCSGNMFID